MTGSRLRLAGLAAAIALAAGTAPAEAKIWFGDLADRSLLPGQAVRTRIAGCAGNPSCEETVAGIRVYIARARGGAPRWPVGRVHAEGSLSFRVPRVAPGAYRLVRQTRLVDASAPFRVAGEDG